MPLILFKCRAVVRAENQRAEKREYLEVLARAAFAAGADGLFMECHPRPEVAKSDGPNAFYLEHVGEFVKQILEFRKLAKTFPKLLPRSESNMSAILPPEVFYERLKKIRLLLLDVDGVLTDGSIFFVEGQGWTRVYNVYDGYGIKLIQKFGIPVGVISGGNV